MEILEFDDVLSSAKIEEIKKQIRCRHIAFGKFINGISCVYLNISQERLDEGKEMELSASYLLNKNGFFLNIKNTNVCETNSLYNLTPFEIRRVFTYSSEDGFVDLDAFFENIYSLKFDYTDYLILSHCAGRDESLLRVEENGQFHEIYSGKLDGVTNYAFNSRYLFLKTECEDYINPNDYYDEFYSDYNSEFDGMDDITVMLSEETKKYIYSVKYGLFDLDAKKHIIFADGKTIYTNSANGFPNIRIFKDEISFCNKLVSPEIANEAAQEEVSKKIWGAFQLLDNRNYIVKIYDPFIPCSKKTFYTDNYFSTCSYRECNLFGKDYYEGNKTTAFALYFAKPIPCVVVNLREYTLESGIANGFFGRVIHTLPGIFYTISQGKYTGMNILWMLENCPDKVVELISSGYLYLLNFDNISEEITIDKEYKKRIQKALMLVISYNVIENLTDYLTPLFAFSNYFEPEYLKCDNCNKTFENLVLFESSFIIELLQKHSLYIEPHVIKEMKQKYEGKKRMMTILTKIEKENDLSTDFLNKELDRLEEEIANWRQESIYEDELDFYENDTTWYEGDSDAQWNID